MSSRSFKSIYYHIVFRTKLNEPYLTDREQRLDEPITDGLKSIAKTTKVFQTKLIRRILNVSAIGFNLLLL